MAPGVCGVEFGVPAPCRQQRLVRARFGDAPVLHDNYAVQAANGREAMGDNKGRAFCYQRVQRAHDKMLRFGIERPRGLIKNKNRRIL